MIKESINDFIPQQVLAITRLHDVAPANHCCLSIQLSNCKGLVSGRCFLALQTIFFLFQTSHPSIRMHYCHGNNPLKSIKISFKQYKKGCFIKVYQKHKHRFDNESRLTNSTWFRRIAFKDVLNP